MYCELFAPQVKNAEVGNIYSRFSFNTSNSSALAWQCDQRSSRGSRHPSHEEGDEVNDLMNAAFTTLMVTIIWSENIDLSQLFCGIEILPKINLNWKGKFLIQNKYIGNANFQLKTHFVCLYNISTSQKFNTMHSLYPTLKYSLSFSPQMRCQTSLIWIFALNLSFILLLGRISIPQKSCDRSIFSLHMKSKSRAVTDFPWINTPV